MTNTPTGDISRLPKWAQRKIEQQEREILSLQDSLSVLEGAIGVKENSLDIDTDVWIQKFEPGDIPLPKGSTILFGNRDHHFSVELHDAGALDIHSGWGPIDIHPIASNHIRVSLRERLRR